MQVLDISELTTTRSFPELSDTAAPQPGPHLLVVIDHREARVYQVEPQGALPQRISLFAPHGDGRHLRYVEDDPNGRRRPDRTSFYAGVARDLRGAGQVLLFGTGIGAQSAVERLLAELQHHHPDVARRVLGSLAVDQRHLTEDQLLAHTRAIYHSAHHARQSDDRPE